jgi:hypothetical protein
VFGAPLPSSPLPISLSQKSNLLEELEELQKWGGQTETTMARCVGITSPCEYALKPTVENPLTKQLIIHVIAIINNLQNSL